MKRLLIIIICVFCSGIVLSQTPLPLPNHSSVYLNQARGYWFIAPSNFTIVGLRVPVEAGTGPQYIHVMKLHNWNPLNPPTFTAQTSNFTTLIYINGATNGVIQNVNIPIAAGDIIGILGTAGVANSYATGSFMSSINGQGVSIQRFGYQVNINTGPAPLCWGVALGTGGSISRVEMWYGVGSSSPNDAGITDIIEPLTGCVGTRDVEVEVSNLGINQITSVTVHWSINGIFQTPYVHNQLLDTANGVGPSSAAVTLGSVNFVNTGNYNIRAWTVLPNAVNDTVNYNDTSSISLTGVNYPTGSLGIDTTICPGEPITLTASSSIPDSTIWNDTTTTNSRLVGIAGFYKVSIYKSGCRTDDSINVSMYPAPPAVNLGNDTTICYGDVLTLNATAPGVTYKWQDNSTAATYPADTSRIYSVILEDANTCKSSDSIEIELYQDPRITLFVSPGTTFCYGTPFVFTANGISAGSKMYQLVVNGVNMGSPQVGNTFTSPAINYGDTVRVDMITDQCASNEYAVPSNNLVMFIKPEPRLINAVTADTVIENTKKNYALAPVANNGYLWRVSGGSINGDSTTFAVQIDWDGPNPNAWVSVTERDATNCSYENILPVNVISIEGIIESENGYLGNAYPNPANKTITIPVSSKAATDIQLGLYDLTGKEVRMIYRRNLNGSRNFVLDVSELNEGIYFYRLTFIEGGQVTRKIMIKH